MELPLVQQLLSHLKTSWDMQIT